MELIRRVVRGFRGGVSSFGTHGIGRAVIWIAAATTPLSLGQGVSTPCLTQRDGQSGVVAAAIQMASHPFKARFLRKSPLSGNAAGDFDAAGLGQQQHVGLERHGFLRVLLRVPRRSWRLCVGSGSRPHAEAQSAQRSDEDFGVRRSCLDGGVEVR